MTGDGTQLFVASDQTGTGRRARPTSWLRRRRARAGFARARPDAHRRGQRRRRPAGSVRSRRTASRSTTRRATARRSRSTSRSARPRAGNFGAPAELTELADTAAAPAPPIRRCRRIGGSSCSRRPRTGTTGVNDLWYATRADAADDVLGARARARHQQHATTTATRISRRTAAGCTSTRRANSADDWDLMSSTVQCCSRADRRSRRRLGRRGARDDVEHVAHEHGQVVGERRAAHASCRRAPARCSSDRSGPRGRACRGTRAGRGRGARGRACAARRARAGRGMWPRGFSVFACSATPSNTARADSGSGSTRWNVLPAAPSLRATCHAASIT